MTFSNQQFNQPYPPGQNRSVDLFIREPTRSSALSEIVRILGEYTVLINYISVKVYKLQVQIIKNNTNNQFIMDAFYLKSERDQRYVTNPIYVYNYCDMLQQLQDSTPLYLMEKHHLFETYCIELHDRQITVNNDLLKYK